MKDTKNITKRFIFSILIIAIASVLTFGYTSNIKNKMEAGQKNIMIEVKTENYSKEYDIKTDKNLLSEVVADIDNIKTQDSSYGLFIVGADGVIANEANQEWWKVSVNDVPSEVGISSITLEDNQKITLELTKGW